MDTKQHHSALNKQNIMLYPALEKEAEMIIPSEVRDTGRDNSI